MAVINYPLVSGVGASGGGGGGDTADLEKRVGTTKVMSTFVRQTVVGLKTPLTELAFAVEPNKKYRIEYNLTFTSNGGVNVFRFWPLYPTNCVRSSFGSGDQAPSNSFQPNQMDDYTAQLFSYAMPNNGGFSSTDLHLNIETGPNAGTVTLQFDTNIDWGQVHTGSYATLKEIF